ncbi:MAG: GNAT family N-acetyltransferase [Nocardioidaceae bacterium]
MSKPDEISVHDNPRENRYEAHAGDALAGFVDYRPGEDVVALVHTEVLDEFEGQGVAGALVSAVLDDLRGLGRKVDAQCPYVDSYIDKHSEYADLRA